MCYSDGMEAPLFFYTQSVSNSRGFCETVIGVCCDNVKSVLATGQWSVSLPLHQVTQINLSNNTIGTIANCVKGEKVRVRRRSI